MRASPEEILRAARLSLLPGRTVVELCRQTGLSRITLSAARKKLTGFPGTPDLLLAALSRSGEITEGQLPADLGPIANFIDWQNHDGCTIADVQKLLDALVSEGALSLSNGLHGRWRLLRPWP